MSRSKRIVLSLLILLVLYSGIKYTSYIVERRNEINDFFQKEKELKWASSFLDKTINFCIQEWPFSIEKYLNNIHIAFSPSRRYRAEQTGYGKGTTIYDNLSNRPILFTHHEPGHQDIRWARNEKYIIYLKSVEMDDDFATPEVFIGDLENKKFIYFFDAEVSNCALYYDDIDRKQVLKTVGK